MTRLRRTRCHHTVMNRCVAWSTVPPGLRRLVVRVRRVEALHLSTVHVTKHPPLPVFNVCSDGTHLVMGPLYSDQFLVYPAHDAVKLSAPLRTWTMPTELMDMRHGLLWTSDGTNVSAWDVYGTCVIDVTEPTFRQIVCLTLSETHVFVCDRGQRAVYVLCQTTGALLDVWKLPDTVRVDTNAVYLCATSRGLFLCNTTYLYLLGFDMSLAQEDVLPAWKRPSKLLRYNADELIVVDAMSHELHVVRIGDGKYLGSHCGYMDVMGGDLASSGSMHFTSFDLCLSAPWSPDHPTPDVWIFNEHSERGARVTHFYTLRASELRA